MSVLNGPSRSTQVIAALHRYDFSGWNRAMVGAFKKGANACLLGHPIDACPYDDRRKEDGRLTWSRAFRATWVDGWYHARYIMTGIVEREE